MKFETLLLIGAAGTALYLFLNRPSATTAPNIIPRSVLPSSVSHVMDIIAADGTSCPAGYTPSGPLGLPCVAGSCSCLPPGAMS